MSDISNISDLGGETLRLDGNAAAGMLAEVFPFEMTSAQSACAGCGLTGPLGALWLYGGEMGLVLRCPACHQVQLRLVRARGRYWIDMRGMTTLVIAPISPA
jgi:uncharacterized protein DUF6510